ncbi:sigma-70 family RNA polymerase sigma factor [Alicyclobacillus sp.]|uniref:RNA polymerase sigma factor n=1 Tax=Alicyclobacillus sp. TaxID=61169 RepID=UPI0025C52F5C|nr:sigma-70 family RNA polymerase sigma factor [Alicyclobacillus sp.]MCL6518167.1 sigma-70 family RNA polymerase sigma factor [Alicyclobacillus sp.]
MKERRTWHAEIRAAQGGDMAALNALVAEFSNIVLAVARRYRRVSYEDAVQEGYLALIRAVHAYREDLSVPFPAFAQARVWGDVRTAMRREWTIRARAVYERGESTEEGLDAAWDRLRLREGDALEVEGMEEMVAAEWRVLFLQARLSAREQLGVWSLVEGWTLPELASRCGVSLETCRTWRKRGLRKLRAALG